MSEIKVRTVDYTHIGGVIVTETSETISRPGAATRLHIIDGEQVWLDTDVGDLDGLCIGVGATRELAIDDAIAELFDRIADLEAARAQRGAA